MKFSVIISVVQSFCVEPYKAVGERVRVEVGWVCTRTGTGMAGNISDFWEATCSWDCGCEGG